MSTVQNHRSQSNSNFTPAGGQRTLGTFGFGSFTAPAAAPTVQLAPRRGDDQPRRVGGLSYAQRGVVLRARMAAAALAARKGHTPALVVPAPVMVVPVVPVAPIVAKALATKAAQVAEAFARVCKANPLAPGFDEGQYQTWLDERYAEAVAHQARTADAAADEYEGASLARPSTPAMQRAAAESEQQDARDWNDLADLAVTPEWDHAASGRENFNGEGF